MIIRTVSLSLLLVFGCFGTPLDREIVKSEVAVHGYCPGMHAWCHHEEKCCASKVNFHVTFNNLKNCNTKIKKVPQGH